MKNPILSMAVVAALALGASGMAGAQGKGKFDLGKKDFESKCAVCHGVAGKGNGSYQELLKVPAPDLTVLKKNNGGVFPFDRVYGVIDGREAVRSHGDSEMPIWGREFKAEKALAAEHYVDVPYDMEAYARGRILALIDYLNRLQMK